MNLNKQYKKYKMMSTVRQLNKNMWLFHYLIPLLQLLFIIYFMFLNIMPQISVSLGAFAQVLQSIRDNYLTVQAANIYYIIGICVSLLLTLLRILRLEVMPNYDQMAVHQKLQKILFAITVALEYLNQIGISLFAWCFSEFYNTDGLVLAVVKSIVPLIGYVYLFGKYSTNSLYGWFTIPIIILITTLNNAVSYIIVILISLYLIMEEKNILKKVFFGFASLVSLFVLTNSQLFKQTGSAQMQIAFICLGILIILTPIFIFHIKEKLDLSNTQEKIQHFTYVLNHLKADSPYAELKFEDFYQLYNTVITFSLSNKDDKSAQIDTILDKQPQKLSKNDFLILLQKYLEKQCRNTSESNLLKQIFLFKIKSQLEYSPYTIIKALYTLNEQVQRGNNKIYQDKIFQIFDSTIKKYGTFKNGDLESAYLVKFNHLHESFENNVYLMLDKFENFWRQMAEQEIKLLALDACFEEVLEIESNIEQIYSNIEKFGYFEREKKIIDITRSLYNVYEQVNKYSRDVKKITDTGGKDITHSFIVLQNGLIKFISKDFMKSLGEKGSLSYENVDKKVIFGKDFSKIIDDWTKKISATSQLQMVSVPILDELGVMQLKKVRILWYPSLEVKSRVIITFSQDVQLAHQAFLIYHIKSDTIKYFNAKFVNMFKIQQERFLQQIENYQMFFNELFVQTDIPAEEVKKYLREENTIKCHIYVKNYVERGVPHTVPVQVNVVRNIYVDGEPTHSILKVTKSKQKKQNVMQTMQFETGVNMEGRSFYELNKIVASASNGNMMGKKYANQKFFCKIPNHYEGKISQKQAQLEEKNRWVCRYYIHLLFAVGFLTVSLLWILDNQFLSTRIDGYRQQLTAIENVSNEYTYIYQIYSCMVKQYYLIKHPQQSQSITKHSAQSLIAFFKKSQQNFINIVLQLFLTQFNAQPNGQINYKINFQQFSINTSTDLTTLMDFVENAKRHVANGDVAFLLNNYDNFRNLTIDFEASSTSQQTVMNIVGQSQQYFYILVVITSATLIFIILILLKIQSSISIIFSLIEQIPTTELKQNLLAFQVRKQRIIDIFYLSNVDLLKKKAQVMNSVFTNQSLGTVTSINSDISNNPNQINQDLSYYLDNQYTLQETRAERDFENQKSLGSSKIAAKEPVQTEQKSKKETAQVVQTNRMIRESFIAKVFRKALFIFLLLIFNGIFILDYINLLNEREGIKQIFDIKKNFHVTLLHTRRIAVDAPIRAVMVDYFNKSIPNYITQQVDLAWALPAHMILPQMQNFPQVAQQAFQQNMCKYAGLYIGSMVQIKPCDTYLGGIVTKGFRETFDIFLKNAQVLSQQSLSQFGLYPCLPAKCPPYFQHEWAAITTGQTINYMINLLDSSIEDAFAQMKTSLQVQTALKIVGLILIMVAYYVFDKRFKARCRKAIQYFRIIPKKMMCSMKMTTFMRKNNVLTKLQIL